MSDTHSDWPRTLEWIEGQAIESLKARFATAEIIAREAQTTLTVILAAVGGSAAYAAGIFGTEPATPVQIASAAVCLYLIVVAVSLVLACMMFQSYPALHQNPENLMHPAHSLNEIREEEVKNIGARIKEAAEINARRAGRLNNLRVATALSPFLFAAVAALASSRSVAVDQVESFICAVELPASGVPGSLKCRRPK